MDKQLIALYHQHVAAAFDRQMRLSDFLEREASGEAWHYQVSTATLSFGSKVKFESHDLGTHAELDNSWMWGWCNPSLKPTPANLELSLAVKALGTHHGIGAFSATSYFDLFPVLGEELSGIAAHLFGIVVGGELGYHAHYTMPFENGRFATLIRDDRLRCNEPYPLVRIASMFPQVLTGYPVLNHRAAFLGYLDWYGYQPDQDTESVWVIENEKEVLRAEFDKLNRMTNLTAKLGPHQ